ncbi:MAG: alanine racemase [Tissierellaceae bacterium]|nr:alanine racemase [Tissierellaceae bacterium]
MRPAWIEINLESLRKNIRNLKTCTAEGADFMGVIKADAYGHGATKVAEILIEEGVTRFAVVTMEEGIQLRKKGFTNPILILGHTIEEDFEKVLEYDLIPVVYKYSQALELNNIAKEMKKMAKIHIKIDTGMGRLGFIPSDESIKEIKTIYDLTNIFIEGIYTHLSTADQISDTEYVYSQFDKFKKVLSKLENLEVNIPIKHMANSAATINFPDMHLDMVRPGTSLYGLYPGPEMAQNPTIDLYPVMSIKARLVHIKTVPENTSVSYGRTFITDKPSVLGVVPMGYVDGVFRQLANKGEVLINGKRCPIVGTICMDQFLVDITNLENPKIGDEVVLVGKQGDERITADEMGNKAGTISIEVVTRMGKRMPIVYI